MQAQIAIYDVISRYHSNQFFTSFARMSLRDYQTATEDGMQHPLSPTPCSFPSLYFQFYLFGFLFPTL